jgi:hypothetical protein
MSQYGGVLNTSNGSSRTLIPRSLTYSDTTINNIVSSTATSSNSSSNFNAATIIDLVVNTINIVPNSINPFIIISSPIAFSILKSDYLTNNYTIYPIFISLDMLVQNKNVILQTEHLTIKDNVIMLNSNTLNSFLLGNQSDVLISGFIFPIVDKNINTGSYSGLLYVPNSKIDLINPNSSFYNWTNIPFKYFTNINKGFFKLKYLQDNLTFSKYNNTMDQSYLDLINNTTNLANLQVGALGIADGEIVGLNNSIAIRYSDGASLYNIANFSKTSFTLYNDIPLNFVNNFLISDVNNNKFLSMDTATNMINFFQNIYYNGTNFNINFDSIINYVSNQNILMTFNSNINRIQINADAYIDKLVVLKNFELNNIPFSFVNTLNFKGNDNNIYLTFSVPYGTITFLKPTITSSLTVNDNFIINNNIPLQFSDVLAIQDLQGSNYIVVNGTTGIISLLSTYVTNINITNSMNLTNNIPITVNNRFQVVNSNQILVSFEDNNNYFYNNLFFNNVRPNIIYNNMDALQFKDSSNNLIIRLDTALNIIGPYNGYQDISNTVVNSSFTMTNTSVAFNSTNFIPLAKSYILSGMTSPNHNISFTFNNVCHLNLMSGVLIATTRSLTTQNIIMYNINLWTYVDDNNEFIVTYNSLAPVNNNYIGDWKINNFQLVQPKQDYDFNLVVNCTGSATSTIVWAFKLDLLSI